MAEQMDTTFREVLSQMSQANSVRLLPWFLPTTAKSSAGPVHSVSEALTTIMQPRADTPMDDTTPELKGTTALACTSSPAYWVSTPPPVLPVPDILATGTPVGLPFLLALSLKHKTWDHFPGSTPEGQSSKRAHAGTEEGSISSGCSTLPIQLEASHST